MIYLNWDAAVESPGCGVHSNQSITLEGTSKITGRRIQANEAVNGATKDNMKPAAGTGAPIIKDPFASIAFPDHNCPPIDREKDKPVIYSSGENSLPAQIHCFPITVQGNATLKLAPGDHFFRRTLEVQGPAHLTGEDVFLFFTNSSDLVFSGKSPSVNLIGRKSGDYAGMVLADNGKGSDANIRIPGKVVKKLEGVVYSRGGALEVTGEGTAAAESNWTVIVAHQIKATGSKKSSATIRINSDYESSDVPVPNGVGPSGGLPGGEGTRIID
jgi:hypothetical protein